MVLNALPYSAVIITFVILLPSIYGQPPHVPTNPLYPITASFFKDRFSVKEWDDTIKNFSAIGGDTIILRAPRLTLRTFADIMRDPDFVGCGLQTTGSYAKCVKDTKTELEGMGLNLTFATYKYEEDFSDKLMACKKYDKRFEYQRVAYRLVIPLKPNSSNSCDIARGSEVLVIFTVFSGVDPHEKLIQSATKNKTNVYFGLPKATVVIEGGKLSSPHMEAYYEFLRRVLEDHAHRYNNSRRQGNTLHWIPRYSSAPKKFTALRGYYIGDNALLTDIHKEALDTSPQIDPYRMLDLYANVGKLIRSFNKKSMLMATINLTKTKNNTLDAHVMGFEAIANTNSVDILSVSEGRGYGTGCYYYPSEAGKPISSVDPGLFKILHNRYPDIKESVTFKQHFMGSNNELFGKFAESHDRTDGAGTHFDFWLNIEAFEDAPGDLCLPVDTHGSGMSEMVSRTTKQRMDDAINAAGMYSQKIMASAWDPGFTCTTSAHNTSLVFDIATDALRTIVSHCGWHSRQNMSIVLIGYQVGQNNTMKYYTREGSRKEAHMWGYYFEMDWGIQHNRVPSLVYTQLYDVWDPSDVSMNGTVTVLPDGAYKACEFVYDYRT